MKSIMKMNIYKHAGWSFIFLVFLTTFSHSPKARPLSRGSSATILDFRVTGSPPAWFHSKNELPRLLSEATHYLFPFIRRYPLSSMKETTEVMQAASYNPQHPLSQPGIRRLCAESGSSFLLTGSSHFGSDDSMQLDFQTISCASGSVFASSHDSGHINELQILLRNVIYQSTPFAPPSLKSFAGTDSTSSAQDVILVVDRSGSMVSSLNAIENAVQNAIGHAGPNIRVGAVFFSAGKPRTIPLGTDQKRIVNSISSSPAGGEAGPAVLGDALDEILRYRSGKRKLKILLFTDVENNNQRMYDIEEKIQRLQNRGHSVFMFPLPTQSASSFVEWNRIQKTLRMPEVPVRYGRRVGFLQGYSLYIVQDGKSFYRSDYDVSAYVRRNVLPQEKIRPMDTIRYSPSELNLFDLPRAYARANRLKITGISSIDSGLEVALRQQLDTTGSYRAPYSALIKNHDRSFWISIQKKSDYRRLRELAGQTVYLGLSFQATSTGGDRIANMPAVLHIKKQTNVPRLFINRWSHLNTIPPSSVRSDIVWFLLSEIREIKDVRESRDIRQ